MLHTNLEFNRKSKKRIDQKTIYKLTGISIALVSVLFLGSRLFAASSISWNFDSAGDFTVSDSNKIEVTGGEAKLKLGSITISDSSHVRFNDGTYNNTNSLLEKLVLGNTPMEVSSSALGLLAQYRFENTWNDEKATYNGTAVEGATFSEGRIGTGSYFGATGYVSIPEINIESTNFTVSFWAKPDLTTTLPAQSGSGAACYTSRASNRTVLMAYGYGLNAPNTGIGINVGTNGVSICEHQTNILPYSLTHGVNINNWTYITVVNNANTLSLYVNGEFIKTAASSGKLRYLRADKINVQSSTDWGRYTGSLDNFEVYNTPLSSDVIYANYLKNIGNYGEYTSKVHDTQATQGTDWQNFSWTPNAPYGKELPNNKAIEISYPLGNIDMTDNVGLWHFNGNYLDSSGSGNHGAAAGGANANGSAKLGSGSGSFGGSGVYVSTADYSWSTSQPFTMMAWVNQSANSSSAVFIGKSYTTNWEYRLATESLNPTFTYWNSAGAGLISLSSSQPIELNKWNHIAVTYDGQGNANLYLNGVQVAAQSNISGTLQNRSDVMTIGRGYYNGGVGGFFTGLIDEVAVFNRSLSGEEIGNVHSRGATNVKYQLRFCDDNQCNGESFVGPDGTSNTYYSEIDNLSTNLPSFDLSTILPNRYVQYKNILLTSVSVLKPQIVSVSTSYEGYPTDEPNVMLTESNDLSAIPASLDRFCEGTLDVNNNCTTTSTKPAGTEIYHQICNDTVDNCNTNNTWKYWDGSAWVNANSSQFNTATEINSNILDFVPTTKYFAFKSFLSSGGQATPILSDLSISIVLDSTAPITNATNVHVDGSNTSEWTKVKSTIQWSPGADNQDGVGILGYCVSLDEANIDSTQNLNPATSGGVLQGIDDGVSQNYCPYIATGTSLNLASINGLNLLTNKEYFFSIKAVDVAGNIWSGASGDYQNLFSFKYDGTAPTNPAFISMPSNFISSKDVTITWPVGGSNGASDVGSGLSGLQYRIGQNGVWYGDLHNGNQDLTDLLVDDGTYTMDEDIDYPNLIDGSNIIYFRTIDNAGNISVSNVTGVLKINTTAPNQVQNLQVTPNDNVVNAYSFNWEVPDTFIGEAAGLTYCYTINTLPNGNNCTYTAAGITTIPSDAYATQPGSNNFYVVAKDEAGNINFDTYSAVQFTYSGEAPGIPLNVDVSDLSVKETEDWKLAVTWATPSNTGAGVSSYKVYRSITENAACNSNLNEFTSIADVQGTSFIDTDLNQQDYYYCVKACDSANNCSAVSTTKSNFPTGKYTSPANLISGPTLNAVTTRKAVISWTTDRRSDSKIQIGLSSNDYFEAESAVSAQVTSHTVALDNLIAGTTYYYRAKWTDEDGNTGISEEKSFTTSPAPKIIDINTTIIGVDFALIQLKVRDANRVSILYGVNGNFNNIQSIQTSLQESQYTINLEDLIDGSDYSYQIVLEDVEGGEYDTLEVNNFKTLPRPTVSNIQIEEVKNVAQPTVNVSWTSNTEVSSILTYYPEGREDEARDSVDLDLSTTHEMTLVGLRAETRYILFAKGIDKLGNEAVSSPQFFTTATDTRPPKISNVKVEAINPDSNETTSQIIVSWETDEMSTSQVEYGEGTNGSYAQSTQIDKNFGYKHVVIITNLKPASVYHLKAISEDNSKNTSETSNIVTITPKQQETAFDIVLKGLGDIFSFL